MVAGGAGFIGSHLVDALLKQGQRVVVIDNLSTGRLGNLRQAKKKYPGRLTFYKADIGSPKTKQIILTEKPGVLHILAAQWSIKTSMRDPLFDAKINIIGLLNLLEAARQAGVNKITFASSGGAIYGDHNEADLPLPETATRKPESFYGLTKSAAIDYLQLYKKTFGLKWVALAPGNVYGPRQSPFGEAGVLAIFGQRLLQGDPCIINGDGLNTRDYVHVSDVVKAFIAAARQGQGLYNIGTGTEASVLDVFNHLSAQIDPKTKPVHSHPLPGEVRRVLLDVTKAQKELDWKASIRLKDGVITVVDWLKAQKLHSRSN